MDRSKWKRVLFGDVVRCVDKTCRDPQAEGLTRVVGLEHLDPGELRITRWADVADGTSFTRMFRTGQVLFGKRRAYQRKAAVADFDGICSGDILVFETCDPLLDARLLPYIVQTDYFFDHALNTSAGSLSPRTKWKDLAKLPISLPNSSEQLRIVEVLRQFEAVIEAFRLALASTSLLLTALSKRHFSCRENSVRMGTLIDSRQIQLLTGPFGTVLSAKEYTEQGVPIINPSHIHESRCEIANGPFVSQETAERLIRYQLRERDILLSRKGEMGKVYVIGSAEAGAIVGSDCIVIRLATDCVTPEYLCEFLRSETMMQWLESRSHGTTLPGINEKLLRELEVNIPQTQEQARFVEEVAQVRDRVGELRLHLRSLATARQVSSNAFLGGGCDV